MSLLKRDAEENNTIVLSVNEDRAPYLEGVCLEALMPGHLLSILPSGSADELYGIYKFAGGVGGTAMKVFAVENTRYGKTIDDSYVVATGGNNRVMFRACRPGDTIMAWIECNTASPLTVGSYLCPGTTAGQLININDAAVTTLYPGGVIAISLEAVSGDVTSRLIKVQIV